VRFEVNSAFVVGGLLFLATCLDYCRNGYTLSLADITGNLDDYLAGTLLLLAAWFSIRVRSFASVFLVLAWAYGTSLMVGSSWGQIHDTFRGETEPYNGAIILVKVAMLIVCVVALARSFRLATLLRDPGR